MSGVAHGAPVWIRADGPCADVVVTTRARLARNIARYPFPHAADDQQKSIIARDVRRACVHLTGRFPDIKTVELASLSVEQKSFLLDTRAASVEQLSGGPGRIVIMEPTGTLSIMVNEEDHIRIQSLVSGLAADRAWEVADWTDDVLSSLLTYGFSEKLGYLTSSLSNLGTGLRVSAMVHLAGLALLGTLGAVLRAAWDLGVSVRGSFGEGSGAVGDLYQVSNEVSIGLDEGQIVQKVRAVAEYLLSAERAARKELIEQEPNRILESARRSLAVTQGARSLNVADAMRRLSMLRLAVSLGLLAGCSLELANQLLLSVQAGVGDSIEARMRRASVVREKLAAAHVVAPGNGYSVSSEQ